MTALRKVAERSISRARNAATPPRSGELQTLTRNVERLWELLRTHAQEHHAIGETNRLSADAIREDREELRAKLERDATALIHETKEAAEAYRARLDEAIEPADTPSEERLGNARADAKLALDGAEPEQLFSELQDLATEGDPAIRHLLLFTPWVDYYTRSRNAGTVFDRWQHARRQLMVELLTEQGMSAFQSLDTAADLAEVPARMRNALSWYTRDLPQAGRKASA